MTTWLADASDGIISGELCGYLIKKRDGSGRELPCAYPAGHKQAKHRDAQYIEHDRDRERLHDARTQNRLWWRDVAGTFKLRQGCEQCGYSIHAVALDFDHIDPRAKSIAISRFVALGLDPDSAEAQDKFVSEVLKCRVLCANCHRVKTREARDYVTGGSRL